MIKKGLLKSWKNRIAYWENNKQNNTIIIKIKKITI